MKTKRERATWDYEADSYPVHTSGSVSTLPVDYERDIGAELRAIYKEVTGKDAPEPAAKPRIGFLP
jgi:hypothetical protein